MGAELFHGDGLTAARTDRQTQTDRHDKATSHFSQFYKCTKKTVHLTWRVKQSHYRPGQAQRVPGGWGSQISRQPAHEGGKVVSPTHRPPLPPGNIPDTHFCWVNPRAIVRPEGLCQRKIPVTSSGIEPATFRLVAQWYTSHISNKYCLQHKLILSSSPQNKVSLKVPATVFSDCWGIQVPGAAVVCSCCGACTIPAAVPVTTSSRCGTCWGCGGCGMELWPAAISCCCRSEFCCCTKTYKPKTPLLGLDSV